ncbi:hypothetical protein BV22DRAFT_885181 [Leucogyrophana mollusca]|uniref:Uncharacterized protein n=1 Tax=Leucogyrophana mollusca TaxID=85980 RepID=A0ACB8AZP4_9AGAM|nr:hypothetical protein BV22DRAFT_885181 [Leucogyrophana mollusca]
MRRGGGLPCPRPRGKVAWFRQPVEFSVVTGHRSGNGPHGYPVKEDLQRWQILSFVDRSISSASFFLEGLPMHCFCEWRPPREGASGVSVLSSDHFSQSIQCAWPRRRHEVLQQAATVMLSHGTSNPEAAKKLMHPRGILRRHTQNIKEPLLERRCDRRGARTPKHLFLAAIAPGGLTRSVCDLGKSPWGVKSSLSTASAVMVPDPNAYTNPALNGFSCAFSQI